MSGERDSVILKVKSYCSKLMKKLNVERVVLFGSWARGDYLIGSDIDLIVISKDFKQMPFLERLEMLSLNWPFNKAADIIGYTPEEYLQLEKKSVLVREAKREGITIYAS